MFTLVLSILLRVRNFNKSSQWGQPTTMWSSRAELTRFMGMDDSQSESASCLEDLLEMLHQQFTVVPRCLQHDRHSEWQVAHRIIRSGSASGILGRSLVTKVAWNFPHPRAGNWSWIFRMKLELNESNFCVYDSRDYGLEFIRFEAFKSRFIQSALNLALNISDYSIYESAKASLMPCVYNQAVRVAIGVDVQRSWTRSYECSRDLLEHLSMLWSCSPRPPSTSRCLPKSDFLF